MSTITQPRRSVKSTARPLNVSLLLTIRETDYAVAVIDPGPDNVKAYRLEKLSGDREAYDLARTNDGLVICSCSAYVASHEGTVSTCKHGSALVLTGLLPKPCCVAPATAKAEPPPAPKAVEVPAEPPACVVPKFDREPYRIANIVAKGDACWLIRRPSQVPAVAAVVAPVVDVAPAACCPAEAADPCSSCLDAPAPADVPIAHPPRPTPPDPTVADDWRDDDVISLGPDAEPVDPAAADPFDAWIARQADAYATIATPRAAWLAGKIARLAEQARFLDATTPEAFDDRLDCMLDADMIRAEGMWAAACG